VHSFKTGPRNDGRNRSSRPQQDQGYAKNHNDLADASRVGALEGAVRVANLKLLLTKVAGDVAMLAAAVQLKLPGFQQMLDGEKVVGSELATHIEETLALDQGWLDTKHEVKEISAKTVEILHGRDISDFEKEIRHSEQKGQDIMKTAAAATLKPAAPSATSERPNDDIIETRIANLMLLTQARGAKSRLARALGVSESIISFLFNRKKEFSNRFSRDFEKSVHLPAKWLDRPHAESDVPEETWNIVGRLGKPGPATSGKLAKAPSVGGMASLTLNFKAAPTELERLDLRDTAPAQPASPAADQAQTVAPQTKSAERAPRVHRVSAPKPAASPSLSLKMSTSAPLAMRGTAPVAETLPELDDVAPATPSSAPEPTTVVPSLVAAPKSRKPAKPAPVVAVPTTSAEPAASTLPPATSATVAQAESAEAPISTLRESAAPAAAALTPVEPAPAPTPTAPVVQIAASTQPAGLAAPTGASLSPITEALLKLLTLKAQDGSLSDKEAYRMLGEIAGL
jgi:hypothetical protein